MNEYRVGLKHREFRGSYVWAWERANNPTEAIDAVLARHPEYVAMSVEVIRHAS